MTTPQTPPLSAAVQAAVEQEARFKTVEAGVEECRRDQIHTVELFNLRLQDLTTTLQRDKSELDEKHERLLEVATAAMNAAQKTNGSVADAIQKIAALQSTVADHSLDIEELSGGLQAVRAAQASRDGRDGVRAAHDKGFWDALGMQWKILLALGAGAGAIVTLIGAVATIIQLWK